MNSSLTQRTGEPVRRDVRPEADCICCGKPLDAKSEDWGDGVILCGDCIEHTLESEVYE